MKYVNDKLDSQRAARAEHSRALTRLRSFCRPPPADKCILNGRSGSINVKRELRCAPKSSGLEILSRNLTIAAQIRYNSLLGR